MKIGIIVYSQTGHTYEAAQKLQEKLSASGHLVSIERISPVDEKQMDPNKIQFKEVPDVSAYEALVFGAPVMGFSLSLPMTSLFMKIASLSGKKVVCFITKSLPFYWTGGTRAINTMVETCKSKGANVSDSAMIIWKKHETAINEMVEKFNKLFA